ncbi:MAG: V-type ATP synthase subunit D [Acutalibacteraceae bacterium]|jgi:V/A-type H+-transporting ATPase subunit D
MAVLNVNPTRMELTNLKRKLTTARRGHKLLKDKRDELMRQFLDLIYENQRLRKEVEDGLLMANRRLALAASVVQPEILDTALLLPKQSMKLRITEKNVMSVNIPEYAVEYRTDDPEDMFSYGFAATSADMDGAIHTLSELLPKMIRLAQVEKSCQLMASEIEKTRRRVNALEHVMIPRYEETIRFITMKLDENERSTITRLMKVKDMMVTQAIEAARQREA